MRVSAAAVVFILMSVSTGATGRLGDAAIVTNNPFGVVYKATLPDIPFNKNAFPDGGNVKGSIYALSSPDGTGVTFKVQFSELPKEGGPFLYHLHEAPVPDDGNCTATLAHLDPFKRSEVIPCDPTAPQTCQIGDLSGKHGNITSEVFNATYTENYVSLEEGTVAFFGNRSFVLRFGNKTRITCANFEGVDLDGCTATRADPSIPLVPGFNPGTAPNAGDDRGNKATANGAGPPGNISPIPAVSNASVSTLEAGTAACAVMF
ncbi:cytosolic Cu/Zn superoxide dismutase [Diaporthe sp. PMI_573]|nr:cytosolic Cu/Zn superoxide dismutase [Diaporthaceae sp. PMI_573]